MSLPATANMSTPSPTPTIMSSAQQLSRPNKVDQPQTMSSLESKDDELEERHPKDLTPPPSPSPPVILEGTTSTVIVENEHENENQNETWNWWQGYRKDRTLLGFEAPPGKNVALLAKRHGGPRKRKRDDD